MIQGVNPGKMGPSCKTVAWIEVELGRKKPGFLREVQEIFCGGKRRMKEGVFLLMAGRD